MSDSYIERTAVELKGQDRFFVDSGINRFGERLKIAMEIKGILSNVKMGELCGWSDTVIRNYLIGKTYPSLERLATIAYVLECSPVWLLTGSTSMVDESQLKQQQKTESIGYKIEENPILSMLTPSQLDLLSRAIISHGVSGIVSALNNTTSMDNFLQLTESERARVLRLYEQIKEGDAKTCNVASTPTSSDDTKKAG